MAAKFTINDIKQELFDVIVKEEIIDSYTVNEHVDDNTIEHDFVLKKENNMLDYEPITIKVGKARKNPTTVSTTIHPAHQVNLCDCTENNVHQIVPVAPRKYIRKTQWGVHPMTRRSQSQKNFEVVIQP